MLEKSLVLHVIAPAGAGGAETVVAALAAAMGDGAHVAAMMQDRPTNAFVARLASQGVPTTEIRCGRRHYMAEVRELEQLVNRLRVGVLHTHGYHADLIGYRAARNQGVPVVTTAHGFTGGGPRNLFYEWLDRRVLRRFDAVIAVSRPLGDQLQRAGVPPERLHLIPNGQPHPIQLLERDDARARLGLPTDVPIVGWIGRFTGEKGPDLFVEAVADLEGLAAMIGDGPKRPSIESDAKHVRFLGQRADAPTLHRAFDVLVISSRTEGTPMVLLEAMGAGVPVVAFAVGGIPDVLAKGGGWLVPPGDVTALGHAVAEALGDSADRDRRTARATQILEDRFGHAAWLESITGVYESVRSR